MSRQISEERKEKIKNSFRKMHSIAVEKIQEEPRFTGKLVFEIDVNCGGFGNCSSYIQRKLK
jgi:hypothetical protein